MYCLRVSLFARVWVSTLLPFTARSDSLLGWLFGSAYPQRIVMLCLSCSSLLLPLSFSPSVAVPLSPTRYIWAMLFCVVVPLYLTK